jgi:BON domain
MGLLRAIGRAAPVIVAGAAAGWYLRRQGLLGGAPRPALPWPPDPPEPPPPAPEPPAETVQRQVVEPPPEDPPAVPDDESIEHHAEAVEAVSDAADVTAVVEDLLAAAPGEAETIVDAEVVEEEDPAEQAERELTERVRIALAEQPGLLAGSVSVVASGGTVWLRGQLDRPEAITDAGRRAAAVEGVADVRNLLHLPGTPPPSPGGRAR